MKLHQELQQTCSSAMAVEERSRISYHHLSLSGRTVPKNTQFDKIYLYRFAAGAPEMVSPKEKTHYGRHGYCRWSINAQEYMGDWSNHGLLFLGKNVFLRHFKVKIKTITLEQPITKLWLLESVGHWKWFAYFSELFKRHCATFIELSWCSIKLDIHACLRHLGFCDIYSLSNLLFE